MLGKTVTMYAKKTTVLSNSTVLGVYLDDASNVVKTTADTQDTMKDFLKAPACPPTRTPPTMSTTV